MSVSARVLFPKRAHVTPLPALPHHNGETGRGRELVAASLFPLFLGKGGEASGWLFFLLRQGESTDRNHLLLLEPPSPALMTLCFICKQSSLQLPPCDWHPGLSLGQGMSMPTAKLSLCYCVRLHFHPPICAPAEVCTLVLLLPALTASFG